ncbi:hypothetical protein LINPERHAP1_LOCUS40626 [Linum perenne]
MSSRRNHLHKKKQQQHGREASSDDYGYCHYPPKRREIAIAGASPVVCVKFGSLKICSDNVDTIAEEFIKWEHRKFEASKTMSINYG